MEWSHGWTRCRAYQLGIELCKARLTGVVEDEDGIDHDAGQTGFQPFSRLLILRIAVEYTSMSSNAFQIHCGADASV